MSGEVGDITPIREFIYFLSILLFSLFLASAIGAIIWGYTHGDIFLIGGGVVLLIAWAVSVGITYAYVLNRRNRLKTILSSEQETETARAGSSKHQFLYCWNCGTRNSMYNDKCEKCGKKLLRE